MRFLIVFFMLFEINCTWSFNGGSALFYNRLVRANCWNEVDIAKLRARKLFEQIVPSSFAPEKMDSKYVTNIINYYRHALRSVQQHDDERTSTILKEALADTIGGHLRSQVLPTARFAYYAGYIPHSKVRELHDFYDSIREVLNTQGLGWRPPDKIPEWSNLTVTKIIIGKGKYHNPCGSLVIKRDSSSCLRLSQPLLDDVRDPSAIFLPLKTAGLVSLTSPDSENVLLKYYTTAARCILNSSPAACRHKDFVDYNNDMWHWMKRSVAPHLVDEKLYSAYGGALRLAATVQSYSKGLSRRNLFDEPNSGISKWLPWKTITDTHVYLNTNWTPHLYVGVVLLAGLSIFLMQMCYNFILGDEDACRCGEGPKRDVFSDVQYATVESNIPAMLPSPRSAGHGEQTGTKDHLQLLSSKTSRGSLQTQTVYDLNENTEKLMPVMVDEGSSSSETESTSTDDGALEDASASERPASPPKIETDVSQVQLSNTRRFPISSCSRGTPGSQWTGSSSSGRSTSSSSRSACRRSRSARDLAWARRVVSKHASRRSTSGTELDCTSFTTPPSRR